MSGSKTVESTAFEGARTQSARKHSIFRSMLTTHRQGDAKPAGGTGTEGTAGEKADRPNETAAREST